ncbi:urea transporter [Bacillus sp. FJAT-29790]|uniref:urea transporter n=1 Tax=Bacillus sp. FJAT-29790 TaxID=1895002 RepID=UPI001C247BC6|nr:urea transporter [Bacillus sp. FJAT-29790]MBU8880629.1 urea transporter [Bacillus sp. FJAT-29790]
MKNNKSKSLMVGMIFPFMSALFKSISQVILIENAVTGFIILIAITIDSYFVGTMTLLSALIGTLTGKLGGVDEKSLNQGVFGCNSVLTGIALSLYLSGPYQWVIALVASAIAGIFTATMMYVKKMTNIPFLTLPFIILTWLMLLASYRLKIFILNPKLEPQSITKSLEKLSLEEKVDWLDGSVDGIGQIFFLDNTLSGVLIFIAVFWAGWKIGYLAIVGNLVALLTAYWLGGENTLIFMGLYGYNGILATLAVSKVFNTDHHQVAILPGIIAACLTVLLMAGMSTLLLPYGLPALTMPFVLSTWILLGARKALPRL